MKTSLGQVCIGTRDIKCRRIPHNQNARLHSRVKNEWDKALKEELRWKWIESRAGFLATGSRLSLERPRITFTLLTIRELDQDIR